ncbi:MAG: pyruvate kinase [Chitinophagaceae bacterium]
MADDFVKLSNELSKIDDFMVRTENDFLHLLEKVHPSNQANAVNLLHYLSLRSLDIRELQDALHAAGLSSMASSESHIRGQLLAIMQRLGREVQIPEKVFRYETGKKSLAKKSTVLFGKKQTEAVPYLMITFDTGLADDYAKVKNLLQSGMNIARINCAHDDESAWFRMIQHIKRASKITGLGCKIYMDLAGPKIRTVLKDKEKLKVEEGQIIYLSDEANMEDDKLTVGCTVTGIAEQLNTGETVLFDDGLIEARVEKIESARAKLQVLRISSKKPFIKNEKGINFPDSSLLMPALTDYDIKCLSFINKHANIVGYSFVRNTKDILQLQEAIGKNKDLSLVIKIETPEAVKNLPDLLFCGMRQENIGVMIARGDLAVEIGFERMSEIQEEILWICEAAHVPVIWATQVLENLNKSGVATRSEVTDAAHAALADCVMINKGTHIIRTIEVLRDILTRSGGHHVKKRFTFRPLTIASRFMTK